MHLNSYIVSKDPKKTLGEIIEYIKNILGNIIKIIDKQ